MDRAKRRRQLVFYMKARARNWAPQTPIKRKGAGKKSPQTKP